MSSRQHEPAMAEERAMAGWLGRVARWLDGGGVTATAIEPVDHGTLPWDGVPWQFDLPEDGVVAVGDVQGDLVALDAVLRLSGIADGRGDWCGGRRHLVLIGDLVGGHADARWCVEFVRRLEQQAARVGGRVHALLGNHDVLPAHGETGKWTGAERQCYRDHPASGAPSPRARDAFRGDSDLALWLRRRNAIVRIGGTLFVHAGLGRWCADTEPGAVNATIRAWIVHWQGEPGGRAAAPPRNTRWAVGVPGMARDSRLAQGPLWTRSFKPAGDRRVRGAPSRAELAAWLGGLGVERLAIGHAPVENGAIALEHPYYGPLVTMLDTRLSDRQHGGLSALVIDASGARAMRWPNECRDSGCRERELRRFGAAGAVCSGWWGRSVRALLRLFGSGRQS